MKLITPEQHAKISYRYQIVASALLATFVITITALMASPVPYTLAERLSLA